MHKRTHRALAVLLSSFILTACGGGGGSNSPDTNPPAGNQPPTIGIADVEPVMELTTTTVAATASDPDEDNLTFTWTQTAGTAVDFTGADSLEIAFTAPKVKNSETLSFELKVDDGNEHTIAETVDVVIEEASGVVYSAVEERALDEHLYFHHPAFEKPRRISPEIELLTSISPHSLQITSDHKYAVYMVEPFDSAASEVFPTRIFVAALDGSITHEVAGEIGSGGAVREVKVSPNGQWIAFSGDLETDEFDELYVVPIDGSAPRRKVSGEIPEDVDGGGVHALFYWSPDSTKLLFGGELRVDDRQDVFVADIVKNTLTLASNDSLEATDPELFTRYVDGPPMAWSLDGEWIAFVEQFGNSTSLVLATKDGNEKSILLDVANATGSRIVMEWSSQGQLAYIGSLTNIQHNLFIFTPDADTPPISVGDASFMVKDFRWSPDGTQLAFILRISAVNTGMFVIPANSTNEDDMIRVDDLTDVTNSTVSFATGRNWFPDSQRVAFIRHNFSGPSQVFSNNVSASEPRNISGNADTENDSGPSDFCLSPNGSAAAFTAVFEADDTNRAYIGNSDGSGRRTVTGSVVLNDPGTDVVERSSVTLKDDCWSPDGSQLLMAGDLEQDKLQQLFIVPVDSADGNNRVRVSSTFEEFDSNGDPQGYLGEFSWVGPDPE